MTSNSPGSGPARLLAATALCLVLGAPAGAERPLPALPAQQAAPSVLASAVTAERVRLAEARIETVPAGDRRLRLLSGPGTNPETRGATIVTVRVSVPFVNGERTAGPVIVIGGRPVDSVVYDDKHQIVIALLPAWAASAREVAVQVGWLGDLERTLSNEMILSPTSERAARPR